MLQALPYHLKVSKHFKEQTKTWEFFAAGQKRQEQLQNFKLELLKNTYQFDRATDKALYDKVEVAKDKLGLAQLNVLLYQAQFAEEMNASIVYLNNEAHIVFSGRITQLLTDEELQAVIAHELTHIKLYTMQEGELEIADRIITAIANNYNSEAAYFETARLFRLYTEIFCDRGACTVVGKTAPVITSLVKIATGLEKVSAESYVKQAEEVFTADIGFKAAAVSHPENFIRARAVQLWHDRKEAAESAIVAMIEGLTQLDQLDIFKQKNLAQLTRKYLQLFLKPKWFQSVLVLSQARQFFPDFALDEKAVLTEGLLNEISVAHDSVKEYLSYLLLDFVMVDAGLDLVPFGWAFEFAENIQLKESFEAMVKKELQLSDKKLLQHKQKAIAAYHEVKEGMSEQIFEG